MKTTTQLVLMSLLMLSGCSCSQEEDTFDPNAGKTEILSITAYMILDDTKVFVYVPNAVVIECGETTMFVEGKDREEFRKKLQSAVDQLNALYKFRTETIGPNKGSARPGKLWLRYSKYWTVDEGTVADVREIIVVHFGYGKTAVEVSPGDKASEKRYRSSNFHTISKNSPVLPPEKKEDFDPVAYREALRDEAINLLFKLESLNQEIRRDAVRTVRATYGEGRHDVNLRGTPTQTMWDQAIEDAKSRVGNTLKVSRIDAEFPMPDMSATHRAMDDKTGRMRAYRVERTPPEPKAGPDGLPLQ